MKRAMPTHLPLNGMSKKRPAVVIGRGDAGRCADRRFRPRSRAGAVDQGCRAQYRRPRVDTMAGSRSTCRAEGSCRRRRTAAARGGPGCTLVTSIGRPRSMAWRPPSVRLRRPAWPADARRGIRYLTRRFGWTVDDLGGVEIVTADEPCASVQDGERGFFWHCGAEAATSAATEFVVRLHELDHRSLGRHACWPPRRPMASYLYRTLSSHPARADGGGGAGAAPPEPWLPEAAHVHAIIMLVVCHSGALEQAQAGHSHHQVAWRAVGRPAPGSGHVAQQSLLDATQPKGCISTGSRSSSPASATSSSRPTTRSSSTSRRGQPDRPVTMRRPLNEHPEDDGARANREAAFACVIRRCGPATARPATPTATGYGPPGVPEGVFHRRQLRELPDR